MYAGSHFKINCVRLQHHALMNDGFWPSVYAGRILKDTRASAYNSIENLHMKIMGRPLEDLGAPILYVNDMDELRFKPIYMDELHIYFSSLSYPPLLSEYERIAVYRRVLNCFYLCAIAQTERSDLRKYGRARL